jgi:hypothetical protein
MQLVDLKWIALISLVFQNCGLAIMMRMTFLFVSKTEGLYIPSTAVLNAEILKMLISIAACIYYDCECSFSKFLEIANKELSFYNNDWIKLMIPSILYTLQNSLQYYSMSCLSGIFADF